jgi:hypothetical protein
MPIKKETKMAEQLSPGAAIWYEEAAKVRAEQVAQNKSAWSEWSNLFREMRMSRSAVIQTQERDGMYWTQCVDIVNDLTDGLNGLGRAFNESHGTSDLQQIDELTCDIQTAAYRRLHSFLHPEAANKLGGSNG